MPLFIDDDDTFEVLVTYTQDGKKTLFYEPDEITPPDALEETFTFKRPNWHETMEIMARSVIVSPTTNEPIINPYKFMDIKFRTLIRKWTLKDKNGEPLPISDETVKRLTSAVVYYLGTKIDVEISPGATAAVPEA